VHNQKRLETTALEYISSHFDKLQLFGGVKENSYVYAVFLNKTIWRSH